MPSGKRQGQVPCLTAPTYKMWLIYLIFNYVGRNYLIQYDMRKGTMENLETKTNLESCSNACAIHIYKAIGHEILTMGS